MSAHGPPRGLRYGTIVVAAVVSVLASMPSGVVVTQGILATCSDVLFTVSNNVMYDIATEPIAATNPRQSCDSGPGFGTFAVDLAPDGSHYGYVSAACNGGGLPKWGRINPAANNSDLGDGLSPFYVPLHDLPPTYKHPLNPAFLSAFPTPGQPFGYRFNTNKPDHHVSNDFPLQLYAIDSLSPYREHLTVPDALVGLSGSQRIANFGLGTAVSKDGSKVWYVTQDGVYELDLAMGPPATKIMFFGSLGVSTNATVASSSHDAIWIVDGGMMHRLRPDMPTQPQSMQFPSEIGRAVDASRYPCVAGGMRVEPHAELVTTEAGGTASFTAVLTAPPAQDVTVNFMSTDTSEGTVSPASATFTSGNWSTPQTITVTGVLDNDTANQAYRITTSPLSSADPNFNGLAVLDVDVSNTHVNQLPSITSGSATVMQGSPAATKTLGSTSDLETSAGSLGIATLAVPSGLTVSTVANNNGTLTAPVAASCSAATGARAVTLRATDEASATFDGDVMVTVLANPAPTLGSYGNATIASGSGTTITPSGPPADNEPIASVTASAPGFIGTFSADSTTGAITVTNAGPSGSHTVTVTAADNCGVTTRTFTLTVTGYTDPSITGGTTPIRAAHMIELRTRIDALRTRFNRQAFGWTDASMTDLTIRAVHFEDLRVALSQAYEAAGQPAPSFTDPNLTAGSTFVRAVHILELRAAVATLEALP